MIYNSQKMERISMPIPEEWWYTHTMEYYLALKMNEVMVHGTILMNLEDIMPTEINQSQTLYNSTYMRYLHNQIIEAESRMMLTRDKRRKEWEVVV